MLTRQTQATIGGDKVKPIVQIQQENTDYGAIRVNLKTAPGDVWTGNPGEGGNWHLNVWFRHEDDTEPVNAGAVIAGQSWTDDDKQVTFTVTDSMTAKPGIVYVDCIADLAGAYKTTLFAIKLKVIGKCMSVGVQ